MLTLADARSNADRIMSLLGDLGEPCSAAKIGALLDPPMTEQEVEQEMGLLMAARTVSQDAANASLYVPS